MKKAEYGIWYMMHQRCNNPDHVAYHRYGGRGIKVCKRWSVFAVFLADVGPRPSPLHTIERKNNNRGYYPNNVRWATRKEQARNTPNCVFLTFNGQRKTMSEWGEITGLGVHIIWKRINMLGWTVEKTLTTPRVQKPKNIPIVVNGTSRTSVEWSKITGIPSGVIRKRIYDGWDPAEAISRPIAARFS